MMRALALIVIAAGCAGTAGCGPEIKDFTSAAPPQAHSELVQVAYDVPFGGDELYMSDTAGRRLDEFLSTVGLDGQDRVIVVDRDPNSPWSAQRAESVRVYLNRRQVPTEVGRAVNAAQAKSDTVTVLVERYMLAALDCPDWTQPRGSNPENATHRNFGCADATNLGLMVADKRDLAVGRALGPADGTLMARGVGRYRRDVQKPLEVGIISTVGATSQQAPQQGAGSTGAAGVGQ